MKVRRLLGIVYNTLTESDYEHEKNPATLATLKGPLTASESECESQNFI